MKVTGGIIFFAVCLFTTALRAETIDVNDNHGGKRCRLRPKRAALAAQGASVRIVGPCQSARTVLLGHIPHNNICVMPQAPFGFHLANFPGATATLWNSYSPAIRDWINRHGGLGKQFIWMRAPDIFLFFRR